MRIFWCKFCTGPRLNKLLHFDRDLKHKFWNFNIHGPAVPWGRGGRNGENFQIHSALVMEGLHRPGSATEFAHLESASQP